MTHKISCPTRVHCVTPPSATLSLCPSPRPEKSIRGAKRTSDPLRSSCHQVVVEVAGIEEHEGVQEVAVVVTVAQDEMEATEVVVITDPPEATTLALPVRMITVRSDRKVIGVSV